MDTLKQIRHAASTLAAGDEVVLQVGQHILQCMAVDGAGRVVWFVNGQLANARRAEKLLARTASANANADASA